MEGRIFNELQQIQAKEYKISSSSSSSSGYITLDGFGNDIYSPRAVLRASSGSPYEGVCLGIKILIPAEYPFKPPQMNFETKVWHPNVEFETGNICIPPLCSAPEEEAGRWSPSWTLLKLLEEVLFIMKDPVVLLATTHHPVANEIAANACATDPSCFLKIARRWAQANQAVTGPGPWDGIIQKFVDMGFPKAMAKEAIEIFHGDEDLALDALLTTSTMTGEAPSNTDPIPVSVGSGIPSTDCRVLHDSNERRTEEEQGRVTEKPNDAGEPMDSPADSLLASTRAEYDILYEELTAKMTQCLEARQFQKAQEYKGLLDEMEAAKQDCPDLDTLHLKHDQTELNLDLAIQRGSFLVANQLQVRLNALVGKIRAEEDARRREAPVDLENLKGEDDRMSMQYKRIKGAKWCSSIENAESAAYEDNSFDEFRPLDSELVQLIDGRDVVVPAGTETLRLPQRDLKAAQPSKCSDNAGETERSCDCLRKPQEQKCSGEPEAQSKLGGFLARSGQYSFVPNRLDDTEEITEEFSKHPAEDFAIAFLPAPTPMGDKSQENNENRAQKNTLLGEDKAWLGRLPSVARSTHSGGSDLGVSAEDWLGGIPIVKVDHSEPCPTRCGRTVCLVACNPEVSGENGSGAKAEDPLAVAESLAPTGDSSIDELSTVDHQSATQAVEAISITISRRVGPNVQSDEEILGSDPSAISLAHDDSWSLVDDGTSRSSLGDWEVL